MKYIVLYRPNSEHARTTEEFIRDYQANHPADKLEVQNIDSRDGLATASLYDVMQYPAILALRDDGSALKVWQGVPFPLMDEVASYAMS